jgi:type IV pilus assembly protein PilA
MMETTNRPGIVRTLRAAYNHKKHQTDLDSANAGFTLIELMVVLLIMAILLAIAIPTFLGVKAGAYDRSAQSNLTNALTSANAGYATGASYGTAASLEVAILSADEANISFETGAAVEGGAHPNNLSVNVSSDGQELVLVAYSQSGTCWAAEDNEGLTSGATAVTNGDGSTGDWYEHYSESTSAACNAAALPAQGSPAGTNPTWGTHY